MFSWCYRLLHQSERDFPVALNVDRWIYRGCQYHRMRQRFMEIVNPPPPHPQNLKAYISSPLPPLPSSYSLEWVLLRKTLRFSPNLVWWLCDSDGCYVFANEDFFILCTHLLRVRVTNAAIPSKCKAVITGNCVSGPGAMLSSRPFKIERV